MWSVRSQKAINRSSRSVSERSRTLRSCRCRMRITTWLRRRTSPIIRQSKETGKRELILARWGLVPFFTKDIQEIKGLSTINARSETITKAPTWREPFKKRRCLVPVSSFYEWPKEGKPPKQPYAFELSSGAILRVCGSVGRLEGPEGHWLQSFAILTTSANELMSRVHPRMPVIQHPRDYDRWPRPGKKPNNCRSICSGLWTPTKLEMFEANPKSVTSATTDRNS